MSILQYPSQCSSQILERSTRYIDATPGAISGNGGHNQLFALTMAIIHGFCLDGATVFSLLKDHYNSKCDPPWSDVELRHKVQSAEKSTPSKPRGWLLGQADSPPQVLPLNELTVQENDTDPVDAIEQFIEGFTCTVEDIRQASPYKIPSLIQNEHFHRQGAYLIEMLFDSEEMVNIVHKSKPTDKAGKYRPDGKGTSLKRSQWVRRLLEPTPVQSSGYWLRMNPVDGLGIKDANITTHRFTLLEFDDIPLSSQLALLGKLPLPIATIIYSGGNSFHAWVKVNADTAGKYGEQVQSIKEEMEIFGMDRHNSNPARLSRLPGVCRGDRKQELLYLNPEPTRRAIL